jgi:hypothetical protein
MGSSSRQCLCQLDSTFQHRILRRFHTHKCLHCNRLRLCQLDSTFQHRTLRRFHTGSPMFVSEAVVRNFRNQLRPCPLDIRLWRRRTLHRFRTDTWMVDLAVAVAHAAVAVVLPVVPDCRSQRYLYQADTVLCRHRTLHQIHIDNAESPAQAPCRRCSDKRSDTAFPSMCPQEVAAVPFLPRLPGYQLSRARTLPFGWPELG